MTRVVAMTWLLAVAAWGCGGSTPGGGGGTGGGAGTGGGNGSDAHVSWLDDGSSVTAIGFSAIHVLVSQTREGLQVLGETDSLAVMLTVEDAAPLAPRTFMCNQPAGTPSARFNYHDNNASPPLPMSPECTVTLTQLGSLGGPPAIGTFTGIFVLPSGTRRNITDGSFIVPHVGPTP